MIGPEPLRKVAGILLEAAFADDRLDYLIVGMGLNVNLTAAQLPAAATRPTSLLLAAGRQIDRLELLTLFLAELERRYEAAEKGVSPHEEWQAALVNIGQMVTVYPPGAASWSGTAVGTDEWGRLRIRTDAGKMHAVAAGDVSLRRPDDKMT